MKSLSLPALLLAVVLATPACTYLDQAATEPPSLTWTGVVPPSATQPAPTPDTTGFPESAEAEPLPSFADPAPLPQQEPNVLEPEPEDYVEAPEAEDAALPDEDPEEMVQPPPFHDPFDERPSLDPEQPEERVVRVEVPEEPTEREPSPSAAPTGSATLAERTRNDRPNLSLPAGLTGENKPDGLSLRFRRYVPPNLPSFVPVKQDELPLFIADEMPEGWLAFYKGDCGGLGDVCQYEAALYAPDGTRQWSLGLNEFLRQRRFVEIQDVRLHEGNLYFNEACATYSDEVDGQCSYLVRVDPERAALEWRTPPLTSNNIFIFYGPHVISGYGFTAEPDALYLIDQESGSIVAETGLDSAHEYMEIKDGLLHVVTYRSIYTFALDD